MVSKPTPTPTVEETPTLDVLQQLQFAVHTHITDPAAPLRARKRPEDPQDNFLQRKGNGGDQGCRFGQRDSGVNEGEDL